MTDTTPKIAKYTDIPGWFNWLDRLMFDTVLGASDHAPGVLIELGAYLGRSAVIIGNHLRDGERFVVVDLFGGEPHLPDSAAEEANRRENARHYESLTRQEFEANYLALHKSLPVVVHGLSSEVVEHVEPGTARFIHIDASHVYAQVADDARNAKLLLRQDGVVVFDDYRAEHTPGAAAAVWAAAANDGLIPFALTGSKFYGTFGDPSEHLATIRKLVGAEKRLAFEEHRIFDHAVIRLKLRAQPKKAAAPEQAGRTEDRVQELTEMLVARLVPRIVKELRPVTAASGAASGTAKLTGSAGHRVAQLVARDYAPPALTRAVRKRRAKLG